MKGYFCIDCGKEAPVTIRDGRAWFYCNCSGLRRLYAFYREIDNEYDNNEDFESNENICYNNALAIIKQYLREEVFISKVAKDTHLDKVIVKSILYDTFE